MDIFPSLKNEKAIAIDVETHDPGISKKMGPGGFRKDGFLLGIGIYTYSGFGHYYPLNHEDGENYDIKKVIDYMNDNLKYANIKVGANLAYDLEWLLCSGIEVKGPFRDIQIAEPLLDEERPKGYSLEVLAQHYLGVGKDESLLHEAEEKYGIEKGGAKENLRKFAPEYVGPYCIRDCQASLEVYLKQVPILKEEDLWDIFELESKLIPIFLKMKQFGVRVDLEKINPLSNLYIKVENKLQEYINRTSGCEIDCWSNDSIAEYFKKVGHKFKKTSKGNNSFTGDFLENHEDPVSKAIAKWRTTNTMRVRYIDDLQKYCYKDRIHACIHQLSADDDKTGAYGTRSGRLSYSHVNLQKIPKRDQYWRRIIRSLFIPEEGCFWGQQDFSQQEPRLGVHFAYLCGLPGAKEARDYYHEPGADFHSIVSNMAGISRFDGKELNLGSWYGMGKKKMTARLKKPYKEAEEIYNKYHAANPYVKELLKTCSRRATQRGWIKTILGRKAHFKNVVPRLTFDEKQEDWMRYSGVRKENIPEVIEKIKSKIEKEEDLEEKAKLQKDIDRWSSGRYDIYKDYIALNRLIQGSAADQTKKAIVDIYEQTGEIRFLQIQVHDELDGSYKSMDEIRTVKEIMENSVKLEVPVIVEPEIGPNWGQVVKCKNI